MSHQDRTSRIVSNRETIKQIADWLFPSALFHGMRARHGATWKPRILALVGLFWATVGCSTLTKRFQTGRKIAMRVMPWQAAPGHSYQGFLKMLHKWHDSLMEVIVAHLRDKMKQVLATSWTLAGYVVFATDGSRVELPRTKSHEASYAAGRKRKQKRKRTGTGRKNQATAARRRNQASASAQKKADSPQMWLTLLWHVGSGLPWSWRTGPSDCSERSHFLEMLWRLPLNALIVADAGFVGYEFWKTILDSGRHFVIRVGANVKLLTHLGYARQHAHTVYLWPDAAAKKNQRPLVLRLIVVAGGRHPVYLVTDLTKEQLTDRQAATVYAARWGVELFFRTFKQTFGAHKLRSDRGANARLELDWLLLGLWCICLLGVRELVNTGKAPEQLSPAMAIGAFRQTLQEYRVRPESEAEVLWSHFRLALLDRYQRTSSKTSRNYPRKKQRQGTSAPQIIRANKEQIARAKQLNQYQTEFRLTA